jgi:hypothetical protein
MLEISAPVCNNDSIEIRLLRVTKDVILGVQWHAAPMTATFQR